MLALVGARVASVGGRITLIAEPVTLIAERVADVPERIALVPEFVTGIRWPVPCVCHLLAMVGETLPFLGHRIAVVRQVLSG